MKKSFNLICLFVLIGFIPILAQNEINTAVKTNKTANHTQDQWDHCLVVVIGSSTAEGAGASVRDSAWVYRYQHILREINSDYALINLAKGGYTTYHLLPTNNKLGAEVPIQVDTDRNITKALSYHPQFIILNLPSNDTAQNFPVKDQLRNFQMIVDEAKKQGVEIFVCTTQPRNFKDPAQIADQEEIKDSIFAIYGNHALDFWNDISDKSGFIREELNSGDGIHLNDHGHAILCREVLERIDFQTACHPSSRN